MYNCYDVNINPYSSAGATIGHPNSEGTDGCNKAFAKYWPPSTTPACLVLKITLYSNFFFSWRYNPQWGLYFTVL